jgi:hypothetical protein
MQNNNNNNTTKDEGGNDERNKQNIIEIFRIPAIFLFLNDKENYIKMQVMFHDFVSEFSAKRLGILPAT